jgi:hypothetical protein
MIKTFKDIILDGAQNKIRLSTKKGKIGYRIVKFTLFPREPGQQNTENTVKIYKVSQTTLDNAVNFSDGNLLAVAYYQDGTDVNLSGSHHVVFDHEIFNQDIFITHEDTASSEPINYYLELETVSLSDNAAAVSTLRNIRLNPQVPA